MVQLALNTTSGWLLLALLSKLERWSQYWILQRAQFAILRLSFVPELLTSIEIWHVDKWCKHGCSNNCRIFTKHTPNNLESGCILKSGFYACQMLGFFGWCSPCPWLVCQYNSDLNCMHVLRWKYKFILGLGLWNPFMKVGQGAPQVSSESPP